MVVLHLNEGWIELTLNFKLDIDVVDQEVNPYLYLAFTWLQKIITTAAGLSFVMIVMFYDVKFFTGYTCTLSSIVSRGQTTFLVQGIKRVWSISYTLLVL